jgi:hypothetical protein
VLDGLDTAFMYIIGALGMLKLYQLRHADINPNAHVGYALMALFILLAMCGVVSLHFTLIISTRVNQHLTSFKQKD